MRISFVGDESLERNIFELRADKMFRFPDFNILYGKGMCCVS